MVEMKRVMEEPRIQKGSRVDVALALLDKGDKLLDVGCGNGTLGYFAKSKYKEVYGIDISEIALKLSKERGLIVTKVNLNDENIPFEDGYFDFVTCLDVIEHVLEPRDLIKEIRRVLKKEGALVVSTPNIRAYFHLFHLIVQGRFPKTSDDRKHFDGGHLHYFTYKDIEELLQDQGFKIIGKYGTGGKKHFKEFLSGGVVIKGVKI